MHRSYLFKTLAILASELNTQGRRKGPGERHCAGCRCPTHVEAAPDSESWPVQVGPAEESEVGVGSVGLVRAERPAGPDHRQAIFVSVQFDELDQLLPACEQWPIVDDSSSRSYALSWPAIMPPKIILSLSQVQLRACKKICHLRPNRIPTTWRQHPTSMYLQHGAGEWSQWALVFIWAFSDGCKGDPSSIL